MADTNKLGKRVKKYREDLGLTQEQLATNSGLDVGYLNDVEEGNIYPPIGTIIKLSRALGQRVGTFMDDQFQPDPIVVKKKDRIEETSSRGADGQYHYFPLGKGKTDRHMEPMFIRIEPDVEHKISSHEGEEFIIVVSGRIIAREDPGQIRQGGDGHRGGRHGLLQLGRPPLHRRHRRTRGDLRRPLHPLLR